MPESSEIARALALRVAEAATTPGGAHLEFTGEEIRCLAQSYLLAEYQLRCLGCAVMEVGESPASPPLLPVG